MALNREELERLIFNYEVPIRLTQDSPIPPDVWTELADAGAEPIDVLLVPHRERTAGQLSAALLERLSRAEPSEHERHLAYAGTYVVARLTLAEVIWLCLPLTRWWHTKLELGHHPVPEQLRAIAAGRDHTLLAAPPTGAEAPKASRRRRRLPVARQLPWLVCLAGRLLWEADDGAAGGEPEPELLARAMLDAIPYPEAGDGVDPPVLWEVNRNRRARAALWRSRMAVKADAAERTFQPDVAELGWAILDSGIDARHPAFRVRERERAVELPERGSFAKATNVRATYNFRDLRAALEKSLEPPKKRGKATAKPAYVSDELHRSLVDGRAIDWELIEPLVRVPHDAGYVTPRDPHGTHVAGIAAGDWRPEDGGGAPERPLQGVCPGLALYDFRVLDETGGEEFGILAALAFVRWLNAQSDRRIIHGVNLSLSLDHDILNSACGRSPVCVEAERVHDSGVVVVAAAGNDGQTEFRYQGRVTGGYRTVSITDPGNADSVITVGATHRIEPHRYGVSYFSSRGPTGDGRLKPDLVAPGEKIIGPLPDGRYARMDGTSMAAPHVSGAAALLLGRHRELIGEPAVVKRTLCGSATDLGRESYFQGAGMLDILRALQQL
jgi:serine protease AprX